MAEKGAVVGLVERARVVEGWLRRVVGCWWIGFVFVVIWILALLKTVIACTVLLSSRWSSKDNSSRKKNHAGNNKGK